MTEISTGHVSVLDLFGGPDVVEISERFDPSIRSVVAELVIQLRVCCNSLIPGPVARSFLIGSPATWRTLRDVSPHEIIYAVRRVERSFPLFSLPGDDTQLVHTRLEFLLEGATR